MKNLLNRLKKSWRRYLKRMAESNTQLYGNQRLDCCDLNNKGEKHGAGSVKKPVSQ